MPNAKYYLVKPSLELEAIIGKKETSRAELIKLLWAYLKKNNLQCDEDKQYFVPDEKLAKVFGTDKIRGFSLEKPLRTHLSPIKARNN
jgi:chromatin remodeling complex protein RSC6